MKINLSDNTMIFQKLIELREDLDKSQKEIASVLKISQQAYSFWETGEKMIPLKHLNTLYNYYNVSMDYVAGLSDAKNYNLINN